MRQLKLNFSFLLFLVLIGCDQESPALSSSEEEMQEENQIEHGYEGTIRDISSQDLVAEMGLGWNLGNSFDVRSIDKTFWGNPLPTKTMIDQVKAMGFGTLRIPVTWGFHQNATTYTIDADYLDRVQNVVNFGLDNRMHVIINVHHDNDWVKPTYDDASMVKERLGSLWTQVADRFKTYGDSLIFETLNEPRLENSPEEWSGGTAEGRDVLNQLHQTCVDAIRATGNNNTKRHVMISTYAASTVSSAMNDLRVPNDDPNIIISVHSYFPWQFAGEAAQSWGSDSDKSALSSEMDRIRNKWIVEQGRAVIMGEWGAIDKNSIEERLDYYQYYTEECLKRNLLPIVWDDGGQFGLFNRNTLEWRFPQLAETIIQAGG